MSDVYRIPITIADILIELSSPISAAELGVEKRLGPFFGVPSKPQKRVTLRWEQSDSPPTPPGDLIYDPGSVWSMHRSGEDYYAAFTYDDTARAAPVKGMVRASRTWDDLTVTEFRTDSSWQSLLNIGAGELILRTAILYTDGLVFHAAGLDDNGTGIVFVGHSGAGKSTQINLWSQEPGVIAMNDDRIAVRAKAGVEKREAQGGAQCYGTPWGGTANIARNHGAPLAALVLLEQAPDNTIQRISAAAAAPLLMARAFLPYWDRALLRLAMANLDTILARVPVYRLRCRPERAVIPLVRSALCSSPTLS